MKEAAAFTFKLPIKRTQVLQSFAWAGVFLPLAVACSPGGGCQVGSTEIVSVTPALSCLVVRPAAEQCAYAYITIENNCSAPLVLNLPQGDYSVPPGKVLPETFGMATPGEFTLQGMLGATPVTIVARTHPR